MMKVQERQKDGSCGFLWLQRFEFSRTNELADIFFLGVNSFPLRNFRQHL